MRSGLGQAQGLLQVSRMVCDGVGSDSRPRDPCLPGLASRPRAWCPERMRSPRPGWEFRCPREQLQFG